LPSERICSIDLAADGTLWFRTGRGFARFDGNRFSSFTGTEGLLDDQVNALHITPDGTVWAGTAGGGVSQCRDGRITSFTSTRNRLAHDKVNAIYRDSEGVVWFGTDGGVSRFDGIGWSSLDERDGLAGNRVNAIAQDPSGAFWFGTDKGLTRYRPPRIQPHPPVLTIDTGEAVKPGETVSVLAGRLVRCQFQAVDLNNRPQNRKHRFQIRPGVMAGSALGESWLPSTDASQVEWTTNRAGAYTFAVQYLDLDLKLSEPAIAVFHIVPPWYRNAWIAGPSSAGVLALLGSSLFLGSRYYSKRKESLRLREAMFVQEHHAREALEAKNAQLEQANRAAEHARLEAEQANKAKSLFLANMSHEIRTPMNAILGYAEILHDDPFISPKQNQALATIRRSGDHLLALINEILDLSKIEAGKMELNLTDFDLYGCLRDMAAIFELRTRHKHLAWRFELLGKPGRGTEDQSEHGASLHEPSARSPAFRRSERVEPAEAGTTHAGTPVDKTISASAKSAVKDFAREAGETCAPSLASAGVSENGVWVRGDLVKLGQVLMNLLANAVKFTEAGTVTLKVTARPAGEFVFEVIDTGRGIPLEKQSGLFRPFGQADQSISTDGAGLGLAISRQKLELMGATLRFESEPGQGSRFWFSLVLPASAARVPPNPTVVSKRIPRLAPGFQVRVLVVDDLPENRSVLSEMLSILGCQVADAGNGRDAVKSVRTFSPHIVFMDIRLPDMDGFQATREIQKEFGTNACKIVSFSGSAMAHERQAYLDAGFDDVLAKPLRMEMICDTLRRLLKVEFEPGSGARVQGPSEIRPRAFAPILERLGALKLAAAESNATTVRACLEALEQTGSEGREIAASLRLELERYDFPALRNRIQELEGRSPKHPSLKM
jgi:signal transduction histidine kinase/CheY-like chemotaxis protein